MKAISLKTFSSTIVRETLHAVYTMKGLLAVTDKGASQLTADDIAANFLLVKPKDDLLEMIRHNAKTAAEAAAIIFIHSTCENAVFQLIRILAQYDVEPWISFIEEKKVSFKDISSSTAVQIRDNLLQDYLVVLEKESFPKKIKILLSAIRPETVSGMVPNFEFDMVKFTAIDELRHQLTHKPTFARPIPDAAENLTYLLNTLRLMVALAEKKYPGDAQENFTLNEQKLHC